VTTARHSVLLNANVRQALSGIRPAVAEGAIFRGKRGPYTDRGVRTCWLFWVVAPMSRTSTRTGSAMTQLDVLARR